VRDAGEQFDTCGQIQGGEPGDPSRQGANRGRGVPAFVVKVDPEAPETGDLQRGVRDAGLVVALVRMGRKGGPDGLLDLVSVEDRLVQSDHLPVDAHRRRASRDQQQVRPLPVDQRPKPHLQAAGVRRRGGGCRRNQGIQLASQLVRVLVPRHVTTAFPGLLCPL
jgi:hypothetical protein